MRTKAKKRLLLVVSMVFTGFLVVTIKLSYVMIAQKQYEIQINKIVPSDKDVLKSMEIEVTDKELLKLTNGIIQGMSGSPILQNGKLIGAVTHVFVNDPMKGYAILMETMLYEMEN